MACKMGGYQRTSSLGFWNSHWLCTGWWFGTFFFLHILGIIIPIDELIFFRGWNHQPVYIELVEVGVLNHQNHRGKHVAHQARVKPMRKAAGRGGFFLGRPCSAVKTQWWCSGWWFGTWMEFHNPTFIFCRGVDTINQCHTGNHYTWFLVSDQ